MSESIRWIQSVLCTFCSTCHNEFGQEPVTRNYKYEDAGCLLITKDGSEKKFESEGELAFLDRSRPMMHFNFETIVPLKSRQVIGLSEHKKSKRIPTVELVMVDGVECSKSLPNVGAFGESYDAQAANIDLVDGIHGLAGQFNENSRAALWSMGPPSGNNAIAFALWFQTQSSATMTLISYESCWLKSSVMNIRMMEGQLEVVLKDDWKMVAKINHPKYNDGKWHHVAVSMPRSNCRFSHLQIFLDGRLLETEVVGKDTQLKLMAGGVFAIGGTGHGGTCVCNGVHDRIGFREGA